jgi:hypothetical protein
MLYLEAKPFMGVRIPKPSAWNYNQVTASPGRYDPVGAF